MTGPSREPLHRLTRRRRAFVATTTAITLLALASVALTTIVAATIADVRRTRRLETDAQVRQLLLAGAADAANHAKAWGDAPAPQSWEMALPQSLTERGCRVQLAVLPGKLPANIEVVEVRVYVASRTASRVQILRFVRSEEHWKLGGVLPNVDD